MIPSRDPGLSGSKNRLGVVPGPKKAKKNIQADPPGGGVGGIKKSRITSLLVCDYDLGYCEVGGRASSRS